MAFDCALRAWRAERRRAWKWCNIITITITASSTIITIITIITTIMASLAAASFSARRSWSVARRLLGLGPAGLEWIPLGAAPGVGVRLTRLWRIQTAKRSHGEQPGFGT
jgi:hypothetical protein